MNYYQDVLNKINPNLNFLIDNIFSFLTDDNFPVSIRLAFLDFLKGELINEKN